MTTRTKDKDEATGKDADLLIEDDILEEPTGEVIRYSATLVGSGDHADLEAVETAFAKFVRALRRAGVTAGGVLTGSADATRHPDTGELVDGRILHTHADDIE